MKRPRGHDRSQELTTTGTRPDPFSRRAVAVPAGLPGRVASAEATRLAIRGRTSDEGIMSALGTLAALEMDDGMADAPENDRNALATVNRNLPAVVGNAIERFQGRAPTFHKATNLPIYSQPRMRSAGRALMKNYTDTPLEEMMVVTSQAGTPMEVEALTIFLDRYGEKLPDDVMEETYGLSIGIPGIEGYRAETEMWSFDSYTFLHVTDKWSESVYCWATDREHDLSLPAPR